MPKVSRRHWRLVKHGFGRAHGPSYGTRAGPPVTHSTSLKYGRTAIAMLWLCWSNLQVPLVTRERALVSIVISKERKSIKLSMNTEQIWDQPSAVSTILLSPGKEKDRKARIRPTSSIRAWTRY